MKRLLPVAVAVSLVFAACSSTNDSSSEAEDRAAAGHGERAAREERRTDSPGDADDSPGDADDSPGTPDGGGQGPAAAPAPEGPAPAGEGGGGGPASAAYGPPGQGVTDAAVKVGVWLLNADAACNATGAAGQTGRGNCSARSHVAEANALTEWVNANGGVAGRKLDVIVHETLANNSSYAAQAESACEAFSADEKVFIAMSEPQIGRDHFTRCMAAKGIPVIEPGSWEWDRKDYEDLSPYIYQPSRVMADRWIRVYIDGLEARGFFGDGARVGLVRFDSPTHTRATKNTLLPRLAAHGVDDVEEAVIKTPPSLAALSDMNAELSNHILRFKTAGVNRVLFFANAEVQFFFFNHAASQNFTPRYGMSSNDWLTLATDNAPSGQLDGAIAIGWAPGFDTPREQDPGVNAAGRTCQQALASAGIEDSFGGRNIKCDSYFFLKQVLDSAPALNVNGLRATVEGLGTSFEPVASFATTFGPGRYDGPAAWRHMTYQGSCECFVYEGGATSF